MTDRIVNEYLTRDEVAERYKLGVRTLERGGPPLYKIGRRVLYKVADVEAWIDSHRVEPDAAPRPLKRGRPTKTETIRRR